jgi:hypothetical protein
VTAPLIDLDSKKSGRIMASGAKSVNANHVITVVGLPALKVDDPSA